MMPSVSNVKSIKFILFSGILLWVSCGKEQTNFVSKLYHKTTSYFNGYYNANKLLNETANTINKQYQYPGGFYDVVFYGTKNDAQSNAGTFDKVIEKNDVVIFKHPNGGFADDCRFLNGKSHFFKQNYKAALDNFNYVLSKYPKTKLAPEVWLWIVRSHFYAGDKDLAFEVLQERILAYDTIQFSRRATSELTMLRTEMSIDRNEYAAAAYLLGEGVSSIKNRLSRSRAHFLLGQLYTETQDFPFALENYKLVQKYSPNYDLTFQANLNTARLYTQFQAGKDDDSQIYSYLRKLMRDNKNKEYRDQIYHEFGMLALKKDSVESAKDYFKQALRASVNNNRQKAISYFEIGKIFYNRQRYDSAQAFYDSAAAVIAEGAPEYREIQTVATTLREYVTCKTTIAFNDSVLILANLPKEELEKVIDKVIAEEKKREEERKAREALEQQRQQQMAMQGMGNFQNQFFNQQFGQGQGQMGQTSFYFDDPTAVNAGIQQFQQRWGQRKNEDNWRRVNKTKFGPDDADAKKDSVVVTAEDSALFKEVGKERFRYYADIPRTPEAQAEANKQIEESLYKLAQLFNLKLNEPDSALRYYELLLSRYPLSTYELRARYALYNLYKARKDPRALAQEQVILNDYPNTVYAYLILGKDPAELKELESDFNYAYTGLFSAYRDRQYETAIGFSEFLMQQFRSNPELDLADLQYIRGMSYGYLGYKDSLRSILTLVVNEYPKADVTPLAQKTLFYMENGIPSAAAASSGIRTTESQSKQPLKGVEPDLSDPAHPRYRDFVQELKPGDKVFVLLYLNPGGVAKDAANSRISDFNRAQFSGLDLKTFTFAYKEEFLLPYISSFPGIQEARDYIARFNADAGMMSLLANPNDRIFFMTHTNFKVGYGRKRMEDYLLYYDNILNK